MRKNYFLQTPHVPPSLEQCLQYLQFLQAVQYLSPLQVPSVSQHDAANNLVAFFFCWHEEKDTPNNNSTNRTMFLIFIRALLRQPT
jgi:hypothetical protein